MGDRQKRLVPCLQPVYMSSCRLVQYQQSWRRARFGSFSPLRNSHLVSTREVPKSLTSDYFWDHPGLALFSQSHRYLEFCVCSTFAGIDKIAIFWYSCFTTYRICRSKNEQDKNNLYIGAFQQQNRCLKKADSVRHECGKA